MKSKEKTKLEVMTEELADRVLKWYVSSVKKDYHMKDIYNQLAKSATSVGANYAEARCASSTADYVAKLNISKKEANESLFWLDRMVHLQAIAYEDWDELTILTRSIKNMISACLNKALTSA